MAATGLGRLRRGIRRLTPKSPHRPSGLITISLIMHPGSDYTDDGRRAGGSAIASGVAQRPTSGPFLHARTYREGDR